MIYFFEGQRYNFLSNEGINAYAVVEAEIVFAKKQRHSKRASLFYSPLGARGRFFLIRVMVVVHVFHIGRLLFHSSPRIKDIGGYKRNK